MNRVLELKQQRAALIAQAGQILTKASDEKRALTAEEEAQYSALFADAEKFRKTAELEESHAAVQAQLATSAASEAELRGRQNAGSSPDQIKEQRATAIRSYLMNGSVAPEYSSILLPGNQGAHDFRAAAQTVGTGSSGGYTVPQGFWAEVIAAMKFYGGMRAARTRKISTTMGNALPIPTTDDTGNTGRLLAENGAITNTAVAFGQVTLNAYKWSSDSLLVPYELLQDSGVDIEAFLIERLAERLGRVQNTYFTTGTGSSQPQGVVAGATSGKAGASGQTSTLIYNDLVDLKYAVNRAYRQNAEWMMNDATLAVILKLVDGSSRPLFESAYNVSLQSGEPDRLLGQPVIINNDVATMAASAKSILYGDFANYWIRDVMAMMLLRLTERYADNGQVGFIAFMRSDGKMVDAGQHPVQYYINAAS
jgi:HK97 family phage major capsid protein